MASKTGGKRKKTMKFGQKTDETLPSTRPSRYYRPKSNPSGPKVEGKDEEPGKQGYLDHDEKICVLCCDDIEIFAKGICDHVVCYKCSSRMRVLCEEKYCAVCRLDLTKVVFAGQNKPFKDLVTTNMKFEKNLGIYFQNEDIQKRYKDLLLKLCPLCKETKQTFNELKRHLRQKHEMQYCDICLKNLKIFPNEFRVYTRTGLVAHRKSGDTDDRSYKGHPQCNFCNDRYFGNDELLLHLRKNHFWCHFCEKDGKQEYYENYDDLRFHFETEHFLCEENDCREEKYTSVFRSDIDFQAHKLSRHSKKMSKSVARQARQLNFDIDYGTRKAFKQRPYSERRVLDVPRRENQGQYETEDVGPLASMNEGVRMTKHGNDPAVSDTNGVSQSDLKATANPFVPGADDPVPSKELDEQLVVKQSSADVMKSQSKQKKAPKVSDSTVESSWSKLEKPPGRNYEASFPALGNMNPKGARPKVSPPVNPAMAIGTASPKGKRSNLPPPVTTGGQIKTAEVTNAKRTTEKKQKTKAKLSDISATKNPAWEDQISKGLPPPGVGTAQSSSKKAPPGLFQTTTTSSGSVPPGISQTKTSASGAVPPGLSQTTTTSSGSVPPGISQTKTSASGAIPPGLSQTKTSSSGAVPPGLSKTPASGAVPPGLSKCLTKDVAQNKAKVGDVESLRKKGTVQERNTSLVGLIRSILGEQDFGKFKDLSGSFRRSEIDTIPYYRCIHDLLGENFNVVFSELVDLLPDRTKQNELLKLHLGMEMFSLGGDEHKRHANGMSPLMERKSAPNQEISSRKSAWDNKELQQDLDNPKRDLVIPRSDSSRTAYLFPQDANLQQNVGGAQPNKPMRKKEKDFVICKECRATIPKKEITDHMDSHVECDFPALPTSTRAPKVPPWKQRAVPVHNSWGK